MTRPLACMSNLSASWRKPSPLLAFGAMRLPAGLHNLIHLVLACAGVALAGIGLLDLLVHPLSLWLNVQ